MESKLTPKQQQELALGPQANSRRAPFWIKDGKPVRTVKISDRGPLTRPASLAKRPQGMEPGKFESYQRQAANNCMSTPSPPSQTSPSSPILAPLKLVPFPLPCSYPRVQHQAAPSPTRSPVIVLLLFFFLLLLLLPEHAGQRCRRTRPQQPDLLQQ